MTQCLPCDGYWSREGAIGAAKDAVEGVAIEGSRCDGFEWNGLKVEAGVDVYSAGNEWE